MNYGIIGNFSKEKSFFVMLTTQLLVKMERTTWEMI